MVIHHIVKLNESIKKMHRVLKQGKKVVIYDEWLGFSGNEIREWLETTYLSMIDLKIHSKKFITNNI